MARLLADENFPSAVIDVLRGYGHNVVTVQELGLANLKTPDEDVFAFAVVQGRAVLTYNRRHFVRLHINQPNHAGIIVCKQDSDEAALAERIQRLLSTSETLEGQLLRAIRPQG